MNYVKAYDNLIAKGKLRGNDKGKLNYYTEAHHIIPKSLGGNDDVSNLVLLTGREHFIAHLLLSKIHNNSKMNYALWMMCNSSGKNFKVHSRFYESSRIKHSNYTSNLFSGKKRTEEHRKNLSKPLKGRVSPTQGKTRAKETREKISKSLTGKTQSEETKLKRSESQKGKKKPLYSPCPHCGIITSKAIAIRWHYDNCKHKVKKC